MTEEKVLHLKTQRGQPYGSERRCCEECGRMIWGSSLPPGHAWTSDPAVYADPGAHPEAAEYRRCS